MNDAQFIRHANMLAANLKKATKTGIILNPVDVKFIFMCVQDSIEYRKLKEASK